MKPNDFDIPTEKLKTQISPIECYSEGQKLLGNTYWTFLGISLVGLLIGGAVPAVLIGPMYCGMVICLIAQSTGGQMTFEMLFKGFDFFVPSLIAVLLYVAALFVCFIPFLMGLVIGGLLIASEQQVLALVGGLMIAAAYVYWISITVVTAILPFFACALVVDRGMEGLPAMKLALRAVVANFWGVAGTMLVGYLMVVVATFLCFFPMLLVIPIFISGHFIAYSKIFGISGGQVTATEVY